jgi:N,N'-diacetyllegionaminate synthase
MFDERCLVVAEVAQAHDGSLGLAHSYIDASADAGADAVKFQTHIAEAESTPDEPWRIRFSRQDESRFDYWKRMEFKPHEWLGLAEHARERDLLFISSPFSSRAIEILMEADVDVFKVASGEVGNLPLLREIAATGKPAIVSSGMSPWHELDRAIEALGGGDSGELAVLQCTSEYPCPPEKVGLNLISAIRDRYGLPTGLSDHSGTIYAGLAAVTLGIDVLEVHVTFSRSMFGPDVPASITFEDLGILTDGVDFIRRASASVIDKEAMAEQLAELRNTFTKSIVAAVDMEAGTALTNSLIGFKKPGTGIPASEADALIGRRLTRRVSADERIEWEDLAD